MSRTNPLRDALKQAMYDLGLHLYADRIVDAFLDTLEDRADEWWVEAAVGRAVDCRTEHWLHEPEGLLAVLRGDT